MPVFGAEGGVVDLEFLKASNRGLKHQRTEREVVRRHTVDEKTDRFLAIARSVDRQCSCPSYRRCGEPSLRRCDRSRYEEPEIREAPAVERNIIQRVCRHDVSDSGGGAIDRR